MWQCVCVGHWPSWPDWFRWLDGITTSLRKTSTSQVKSFASSPLSWEWTTWCTSTSLAGWLHLWPSWLLCMQRCSGWSGGSSIDVPKLLLMGRGTTERSWDWQNPWPWWSSSLPCVGCQYTSWTASLSSAKTVKYLSLSCMLAFLCPTSTQRSTQWFTRSG